eukprot:CAMPEP_0197566682 /NCGR_PEP_ID=MMETSP1320-20131121/34289_1 /TAXON_ID=91990 /ORGANISM="Bolidomonas sp., Strain RCC2347" /LENGTH=41 /DNA_ID= /DNA_START= /DNA_END= /DNA_ORIENTATION=
MNLLRVRLRDDLEHAVRELAAAQGEGEDVVGGLEGSVVGEQ